MTLDDLPTMLYRVFTADDRLLYIGITGDLRTRIKAHTEKEWWPANGRVAVEMHPNRAAALAAERLAVAAEKPEVNIRLQAFERVRVSQLAEFDTEPLRRLGERYINIRSRINAVRPELADEIRTAHEAGMPQVEIVRLTGYTRELVRQICLPSDQKPTRAKSARR